MVYIIYNDETGEVSSISQTRPETDSPYLISDEALTGSESDYLVKNETLYLKHSVTTNNEPGDGELLSDAYDYYICYNADTGQILSVVTSKNSATSPYIGTDVNPGDISGLYLTDVSSTVLHEQEWTITGRAGDGSDDITGTYVFTENAYTLLIPLLTRAGDPDNDDADDDTPASSEAEEERDLVLTEESTVESGNDVIVRIRFKAGNWAVRSGDTILSPDEAEDAGIPDSEKSMVYVIASDYVRYNTVLHILGINRNALRGDIFWESSPGYMTFKTGYALEPYEDVILDAVLTTTANTWNAQGKIDAWPQGEWRKAQYHQALHVSEGWELIIRSGESTLIETPVSFASAQLLYLSAEWAGNTHAILSQYYVNQSNDLLYYRITNLSDKAIRLTDVILNIIYQGKLDGFVSPAIEISSENAGNLYITDSDIDEVT